MFVPLPNFGKFGVVSDTLNSALPIGTWTDANNMRFSGIQMEKMLESTQNSALLDADGVVVGYMRWAQGWSDGRSTYLAVATNDRLWFLVRHAADAAGYLEDATRPGGVYSAQGEWDSFAWGNTCIFNNGIDPPQIYNADTGYFEDLPNWGLISSADDISAGAEPSIDTNASCRMLRPYKNYLAAIGITESGVYQPNAVWWSDATTLATYRSNTIDGGGPPSWDYESPATLSGKSEQGAGSGKLVCLAELGEAMVLYTESASFFMQFTRGSLVMGFRRVFGKGAAGLHCVAEFNNRHFVVGKDQVYVHDGSLPSLIAKDRVETEFYTRIGKGGRFGGAGNVNWDRLQVSHNPDRKEITVYMREGAAVRPWILADGAWDDTGYWDDRSEWDDGI